MMVTYAVCIYARVASPLARSRAYNRRLYTQYVYTFFEGAAAGKFDEFHRLRAPSGSACSYPLESERLEDLEETSGLCRRERNKRR